MYTARMSKNGQVVIPHQIRKNLDLEEGAVFQVIQQGASIVFNKLVLEQNAPKKPENVIVQEPKEVKKTEDDLSYDEIKRALELSRS